MFCSSSNVFDILHRIVHVASWMLQVGGDYKENRLYATTLPTPQYPVLDSLPPLDFDDFPALF